MTTQNRIRKGIDGLEGKRKMECSWFDFQRNDFMNPKYGLNERQKKEVGDLATERKRGSSSQAIDG